MTGSGARVFVGLGSNLGDRRALLEAALERLAGVPGVAVVARTAPIETPPWGPVPQGAYLNAVAELRVTGLAPDELLAACLAIERALGRDRADGPRWGPRTIDLDLLLWESLVAEADGLALPHPRLAERRFVLEPLAELAPDLVHPVLGRTIAALLDALNQPVASLDEPPAGVKPPDCLTESATEVPAPEPNP